MKLKVIKEFEANDETFEVGALIEIEDTEYAEKLMSDELVEKYVEIKSAVVETEEKEDEQVVEVKDISEEVSQENEIMDIEVKEEKLTPEKKLMNAMAVAKALKTNHWTEETKAIAGQGETVAADGGALVDEEIVDGIWANAVETGQLIGKVSQRPIGKNRNTLEIKQLNEANGTPADYNGVALSVTAEGGTISPQKLAYATATAAANKLTALVPFTEEILEDDAHGILAFTEQQVGAAFGLKVDEEILYGTSSLLTAAVGDGGSVATTLVDASAPTIAELHDMFKSQINVGGSEWYMSGQVYENINQLSRGASDFGPVIVPNYSVSPFGTLLGRPVNVINAMKGANGEAGTIGLCDWKNGYILGTKGGVKMAKSIHLYFDTDQSCYRWTLRIAGLPMKASTMTLNDGRTVAPLVFGNDS